MVVSLLASFLTLSDGVAQPEPAEAATLTTYDAGAYVVDMGQVQTVATGLKPYGLVYDLVVNNQIPVDWVIADGKTKNPDADLTDPAAIDFSANGKDYRGGPFVIPAGFAAEAAPIISAWQAQGVVVDGPMPQFGAPKFETITSWPNAVLDLKNGKIASAYYANAGIGTEAYRMGLPSSLSPCDDLYVMPHADPAWATHSNLIPFNDAGGYIWAACHAVSVLENVDDPASADPSPDMNFLSNTGLLHFKSPGHDGGTPPYAYDSAAGSDPIMQFLGRIDTATENGSEQIYLPDAAGWRASTNVLVDDPDHPDVGVSSPGEAAKLAYGRGFGNPDNGLVMYEGGHSHNKGDEADLVAAQRAFLNLHLMAGIERGIDVITDTPEVIGAGETVDVSATISGGAHDYDWTWESSCGGTFAAPTGSGAGDPVNVSTTFTAPAVAGGCSVKLLVSDTCERVAFGASATIITMPTDVGITITDDADPIEAGGTLSYTVDVVNNGPGDAEATEAVIMLPPGVTFVSASPDQGSCTYLGGVVTCDLGTVLNGSTSQTTIAVTVDPDTSGTITALAAVATDSPDTDPTNDAASEPTDVGINGLVVDIEVDPGYVYASAVPDSVAYTITVTNTAPSSLDNVVVGEDVCGSVTGPMGDDGNGLLDQGEVWTYTCSGDVSSDPTANTATATGDHPILGPVAADPDTATVEVIDPAITIDKAPGTQGAPTGGAALFDITVTNTGDITLAPVTVTDPLAPDCDRTFTEMAPGAVKTYSCSMPMTEPIGTTGTNTIDVSGIDPLGNPVTDSDSADYTVIAALLDVTKSADVAAARPGEPVEFTITVENPSAVDQTNIVVTDTWPAGLIWQSSTIPAGGSVTDNFSHDLELTYFEGWEEINETTKTHGDSIQVVDKDDESPCETPVDCVLLVQKKDRGIYQPANLSGATSATIDFSYQVVNNQKTDDNSTLEVVGWDSTAGAYVQVAAFPIEAGPDTPTVMTPQDQVAITPASHPAVFAAGTAGRLGFRIHPTNADDGDIVYIDDVTINWTGGGQTLGAPPNLIT
ncbi:MAG: hypothetical protein OEW85_09520, partial [Acidimicrobiia bacterium]|nr:hypothetical protein [Acidimicrobiia bacterium]